MEAFFALLHGPLWGECTGHRWIPLTKASDAELWYFLWTAWTNGWANYREASYLRRQRANYDVTVMGIWKGNVRVLVSCEGELMSYQESQIAFGWVVICISYHYNDIIMGAIASQITSLTIVYSTLYSDADQRKHQSSASLAFVLGIHRSPVNSPHKWPVTGKMFPFDDVIMISKLLRSWGEELG